MVESGWQWYKTAAGDKRGWNKVADEKLDLGHVAITKEGRPHDTDGGQIWARQRNDGSIRWARGLWPRLKQAVREKVWPQVDIEDGSRPLSA
ncbi:hypothetical protein YC2023_117227 [Brassica napus]